MITSSRCIEWCVKELEALAPAELRTGALFPNASLRADAYAHFTGRSLWLFFPYDDYFFIHDLTGRDTESRREVEELHESARRHVNAQYRLPRAFRYRVPNVITVAVSERGFGPDCQRYVHSLKPPAIGGERHSVFLIDLVNRRLISKGIEVTEAEMVAIAFARVNPHNRVLGVMTGLCGSMFGSAP